MVEFPGRGVRISPVREVYGHEIEEDVFGDGLLLSETFQLSSYASPRFLSASLSLSLSKSRDKILTFISGDFNMRLLGSSRDRHQISVA